MLPTVSPTPPVKRAPDTHQGLVADMEVDLRGLGAPMPQQGLDMPYVHPGFHQVGGKAVAQAVRGY